MSSFLDFWGVCEFFYVSIKLRGAADMLITTCDPYYIVFTFSFERLILEKKNIIEEFRKNIFKNHLVLD